jgi:hypothetical protein
MAPVLGLLLLLTTACEDLLFDDPSRVYDGPPVVEFAAVVPAGNYSRTVSFSATETTNQTVNVRVNYIANPASEDLTGEITQEASSTAVGGTHYRFTSGSGSYTIAAGASFADVPIEFLGAGLDPGESVTLVLELVPNEDFGVSENYKQFTFTVEKSS